MQALNFPLFNAGEFIFVPQKVEKSTQSTDSVLALLPRLIYGLPCAEEKTTYPEPGRSMYLPGKDYYDESLYTQRKGVPPLRNGVTLN